MIFLILSVVWGAMIAFVKQTFAKPLFMVWLVAATVLVMPLVLMPDARDLPAGSAAATILALPISLGLGWLLGTIATRLMRRAA